MKIEDAIKERKSSRKYHHKKPDWRKIIKAIDAARYAPMAGNIFSLKFILVQDEKRIEQIGKACQQDFVRNAQAIVVAVSNDAKVEKSYDKFGKKFARQQAGAAIENFLLEIVSQGLATCWVGYFVEDQIKRACDIPDDFTVEAVFPVGIPSKIRETRKPKPELDNIIYFDKFKNKYMEGIPRVGHRGA